MYTIFFLYWCTEWLTKRASYIRGMHLMNFFYWKSKLQWLFLFYCHHDLAPNLRQAIHYTDDCDPDKLLSKHILFSLLWRHNGRDGVSNHRPVYSTVYSNAHQRYMKAPRHWPLWGEFTGDRWIRTQMASNAENVSIWWRHHVLSIRLSSVNEKVQYVPLRHVCSCRFVSDHGDGACNYTPSVLI